MEPIPLLQGKRILLGVTGGIAAYKVCTLASRLTQAGAEVDVVMTGAATRFVTPLTFQSLTGRPVYTTMWGALEATTGDDAILPTHVVHVGLAEAADLMVIAPATANTMAKMAQGLADNLLTTLALAARCPVLLAPAMDVGMWAHPATQANVETLRERGRTTDAAVSTGGSIYFAGPARGRMASGLEGHGRMVEPDEMLGRVRLILGRDGPLAGRRVIVTAGPTREPFDPVRFLSNPSSGRQGFTLAQAALDRGAAVTLIAGPTSLPTPVGAERVDVSTAQHMHDAVIAALDQADVLLMAAAVADYRPSNVAPQKIKKEDGGLVTRLERTPDILSSVAVHWAESGRPRLVLGFAAESENLVENARAKLAAKNLDLIVANDVTVPDAGFAAETNRVVLIDRERIERLPLMSKSAVAEVILDRVVGMLRTPTERLERHLVRHLEDGKRS